MTCTTHHDACECRKKELEDEIKRLKVQLNKAEAMIREGGYLWKALNGLIEIHITPDGDDAQSDAFAGGKSALYEYDKRNKRYHR